jgi:hypothetical protein
VSLEIWQKTEGRICNNLCICRIYILPSIWYTKENEEMR